MLDPVLLTEVIVDSQGRAVDLMCLHANRAACAGEPLDQLLGRSVIDALPVNSPQALLAVCSDLTPGRSVDLDDQRFDPPGGGAPCWYDVRVVATAGSVSITWRDVTDRHVALDQLVAGEERFRLLAENISDLVYFADADGVATWVAPTVLTSLGWQVDELVGTVITDLVHPDDWDVAAAIREVSSTGDDVLALRPGAEHPVIARLRRRDGSYRWMSVTATRVHEHRSDRDSMVVGMRDVDELVAARILAERGKRDDLTGLVNRLSLMERMEQILRESRRTGDRHAVLYCDVDYFKEINDTSGHAIGDEVLRTIAARIRATVRERDVVARLGGDEFVVVLQGVRGAADAEAVAGKIRVAMSVPLMVDGLDLARSFSIGVAMVRPDSTPDRVLRDADAALYEAKEAGRDRIITHRVAGHPD